MSTETEIVKSVEGLAPLVGEWSTFQRAHADATLDADPAFFTRALEWLEPRPRPHVAFLRRNGRLRAIVVGRVRVMRIACRVGYLRFRTPGLPCLEVVHGGLLSDGSPEAIRALAAHLGDLLLRRDVECVTIQHLRADHPVREALRRSRTGRSGPSRCDRHWYAALLDSETGELLERHSRRTEKRLARYDRRLEKEFRGRVEVRVSTRPDQVNAFLAAASAIADRTYQRELGVAIDETSRWRELTTTLADLGYLRAYLLMASDEPIAFELAAQYRDRCTLIAQGFLPEHGGLKPGSYLLRRVLEASAAEKVRLLDFGFGDAWHKSVYGTDFREEISWNLYAACARARVARGLDSLANGFALRLEEALRGLGIFDRVKNFWRARLTS